MKRIAALISAAALLTALCACEDDTDVSGDERPEDDVTVSAQEAPTEPAFPELTEDDFAKISVKSNIIPDKMPDAVKCIDLSTLSFGERVSPCKEPEVFDKYAEYFDDETKELYRGKPMSGYIWDEAMLDGKVYFAVNYDDLCLLHDSSVYCFDVHSGEVKELVAQRGLECSGCFNGLTASGGKLWYNEMLPDWHSRVCTLDPETGETSVFLEINASIVYMNVYDDCIVLDEYTEDYSSATVTYDISTGAELSREEGAGAAAPGEDPVYLCDGQPAEVTGGFDGTGYQPITIKTQYYTLSSELDNFSSLFLWKDKVCIISDNDFAHWIYTYDLNSRERLMMDFSGFKTGIIVQAGDGLMCGTNTVTNLSGEWLAGDTSVLYYVRPEIGTVYRYATCDHFDQSVSGSSCYFLTMRNVDDDMLGNALMPDKLYYVE
ncbi:MAG: hypothetical protein IKP42_04960 [Ruminococcus sp.]|nr:hypothetical protein [Ruminococcus sp.]